MQVLQSIKKGQVLVMVIITMMVLGIILISILNNSVNDRRNTRNTIVYETLYSIAEKNTVEVVQSFKDVIDKLDKDTLKQHLVTLGYNAADIECQPNVSRSECIACKFNDESTQKYFANQFGENGQSVAINVCDSKELVGIPTTNGNHLFYNLVGSDKDEEGNSVNEFNFEVKWEGLNNAPIPPFAMEVILDIKFRDISNELQYTSLRALYKNTTSKFVDLNQDQSPNAEYFKFNPETDGVSFRVDRARISDLLKQTAGTSYARHLASKSNPQVEFIGARFKPLFDNNNQDSTVKLSVRAIDLFGSPLDNISQSRFVQTTVFVKDPDGEGTQIQGSQASVETGIPLYQPPGIFDYILRTQGQI